MGNNFYLRLALTNVKRDKRMNLPFFVATTAFVSIYFMVVTIMYSKGISDVPGGSYLQQLFGIGMVVMNLITVVFMLYINSFLIKRRKKEFGLYGILGLEKRHVGRVIFWENLMLYITSILAGIISGCVFGRLIFLLIFYSLKVSPNSKYMQPIEPFIYTAILFLGIFLITTILNLLQVRLANPIDLLKGDRMGEKKARFILIKTIIGGGLLSWAYYTALTVKNALLAMNQFLIAVIAVIIASYLLFEAGSLVILKLLKGRKNLYYKANNFVAISGLFHRMKQNAAGLASICILSTMVLVTVSTCTALYLGAEEMNRYINPNDMQLQIAEEATLDDYNELNSKIDSLIKKYEIKIEDRYDYDYYSDSLILDKGSLIPLEEIDTDKAMVSGELMSTMWGVNIITLEDYNKICNQNESLKANEVLLLTGDYSNDPSVKSQITKDFKIKGEIPDTKIVNGKNNVNDYVFYFVTAGREEGLAFLKQLNPYKEEFEFRKCITLNLDGKEEKLLDFAKEIEAEYENNNNIRFFRSIYTDREDGYGLYGGLLFLGVFFTLQFIISTVLIIYFKQISEGYDDQERFVILQKVGMDDLEVKRTINKQILIVFFLPLFGALLHVVMARNMILKMLEAFYLYNVSLTTWCILITCLVFVVAYILVYKITARTYYKIVKW